MTCSASLFHLQLWLYHQHNAVTQRVWADETAGTNSAGSGTGGGVRAELWPSRGQCETCISAPETGSIAGTSVNIGGTGTNGSAAGGVSTNTDAGVGGKLDSDADNKLYGPQAVNSAAVLLYLHKSYFL